MCVTLDPPLGSLARGRRTRGDYQASCQSQCEALSGSLSMGWPPSAVRSQRPEQLALGVVEVAHQRVMGRVHLAVLQEAADLGVALDVGLVEAPWVRHHEEDQ